MQAPGKVLSRLWGFELLKIFLEEKCMRGGKGIYKLVDCFSGGLY